MRKSVAHTIVAAMLDGGVDTIFGVPGGQTLPLYGATANAGLTHVLMRDERSAACAADAYARLSGKVGFCDATVGPGATNLVSGLAEALGASIPIIAVVADIRRARSHLRRRSNTSQAIDQDAMLAPVSKWVARVEDPDSIANVLDQALRVATTGRPGPVVLTIPEDVFTGTPSPAAPHRTFTPRSFEYPRFRPSPDPAALAEAVEVIQGASRPLILAGGGALFNQAAQALADLARTHSIPVATTVSGKGVIDEMDPLAAGVTGSFGTIRANAAVRSADVLIVIGCKLGQVTTHGWQLPHNEQVVIHVDIDGEEIGRTCDVQVGIVADARQTALALRSQLRPRRDGSNWLLTLGDLPATGAAQHPDGSSVAPHLVAQAISEALSPEDVIVCDASLSSGWAAAFSRVRSPLTYIAPRGLAGIGWGGGAMIGARLAVPRPRRVVLLTGDGAWGYCLSEIETAARLKLDVTCVVLNNKSLGWIAHIRTRREQILSSTFGDVDFAGAARAMGGEGLRVETIDEFQTALRTSLASAGPTVIDVKSSATASPVLSLEAVSSLSADAYA